MPMSYVTPSPMSLIILTLVRRLPQRFARRVLVPYVTVVIRPDLAPTRPEAAAIDELSLASFFFCVRRLPQADGHRDWRAEGVG